MLFFKRFGQKKNLLIELGNCVSTAKLLQKSGSTYEVIKSFETENPFFRNGIIKKRSEFVEVMGQLMQNLKEDYWSNVTIGIDSSQIIYSSFEIKSGDVDELTLLEHLNKSNSDHKLIHLSVEENKVSCLSIPSNILDRIYSALTDLNLKVNKFIPINYFNSCSALNYRQEKICMVINLGYRSTTLSVFNNNFLIDYKTVTFGVEQIILAMATKNAISIEDARLALKDTPLFGADQRNWVSYSGKYFRADKVSNMLNFYVGQMARKIFDKDYFYVNDLILTGWSENIQGIDEVFRKFIDNVIVVSMNINNIQENIPLLNPKYGHFIF